MLTIQVFNRQNEVYWVRLECDIWQKPLSIGYNFFARVT